MRVQKNHDSDSFTGKDSNRSNNNEGHCFAASSSIRRGEPKSKSLSPPPSPPPQNASAGADRRRLLLTLHVLFPSIVLPALDLLDRKLVARIRVGPDRPEEQSSLHTRRRDADGLGEDGKPGNRGRPPSISSLAHTTDEVPLARLYVVQSLASTLARPRRRDPASPSRTYAIHLDAWSCSCANFALEAFASYAQPMAGALLFEPRASPSPSPRSSPPPIPPETREVCRDKQMLSFGGLSFDGLSNMAYHFGKWT
ncbi:hypothetical protein HRG_007852 [Hirsutella rhossiliensis]|uniref:Uncharacterized protein n=1 Tax=Hirsutella rhossiliensis TaxID=111463 RepID=A0A9P8MT56_9HYPO|nr:uncharacterized protein HRG_07852 [Hirsutella rhossiliensis]KAH0960699.1 hypothetical protein HRG_07852 [Hirsutella rhossiliensis]